MSVWVVGGERRPIFRDRPEWTMFRRAVVVRADDTGVRRVLEYTSPPAHRPDESPSILFKAGTIEGSTAWLCTQTEILVCDVPSFAIRRVISHPCFNDLHHVVPGPDGSIYAAVTGLDAVAVLDPEGRLERLIGVLGSSPWERFSPEVDYRKVPTTKPHRAHPNFVFFLDGRPWVTRLEQRDAIPLDGGKERLEIHQHPVHDGSVTADAIWFTGVDGTLVRFDRESGARTCWDLSALDAGDDDPLGWCRGIAPNGARAWVGFTRIRYTRLRENLSWIRHGFRDAPDRPRRPTRVALYDLPSRRTVREIDLEPAGMGAVFSIHVEDEASWR